MLSTAFKKLHIHRLMHPHPNTKPAVSDKTCSDKQTTVQSFSVFEKSRTQRKTGLKQTLIYSEEQHQELQKFGPNKLLRPNLGK